MNRYTCTVLLVVLCTSAALGQIQIYSNGPLITHAGQGFGGADASALQTGFQMAINGFTASGVGLADDFTVPCGQSWFINEITTYGYQTQDPAGPFSIVSPLTAAHYRIWNGKPGSAGSAIVHDFTIPNQLTGTAFTGIYRVTTTTLQNQQRPVCTAVMNGNSIMLVPGTYWLDYQIFGANPLAAVFTPPVTILNQPSTGNATQYIPGALAWADVLTDAGFTQGLPFQISYTNTPVSCFALNITQPNGFGTTLHLTDTGGTPGNTFLNLITLNGTGFPNGWLFGLNMTVTEVGALISFGLPFTGTLFAGGAYGISVPVALPGPVTLYYVGVELSGSALISIDAPKSITIG